MGTVIDSRLVQLQMHYYRHGFISQSAFSRKSIIHINFVRSHGEETFLSPGSVKDDDDEIVVPFSVLAGKSSSDFLETCL